MPPALKTPVFAASRVALRFGALCLLATACQVTPPAHSAAARTGVVRAARADDAAAVALLLDDLSPRVAALLPDARAHQVEVWVQNTPQLYRFSSSSYSDADGFWAEEPGRIHLRESAENIERTLAHELVHSSLGRSWQALPGTLEEGLCDVVSGRLCASGATRMRGGRLLSAAFATGGLMLELEVVVPAEVHPLGIRIAFDTRVRLEGDPPVHLDPLEVFRLQAGLSSATMASEIKKACYGLSYLVIERIVDRRGFIGLHELCLRARREGHARVPEQWLLDAAELTRDPRSWQQGVVEALGAGELEELVRSHPDFMVQALAGFFTPWKDRAAFESSMPSIQARLGLAAGGTSISLLSVSQVRQGLMDAWVAAAPAPLAP